MVVCSGGGGGGGGDVGGVRRAGSVADTLDRMRGVPQTRRDRTRGVRGVVDTQPRGRPLHAAAAAADAATSTVQ